MQWGLINQLVISLIHVCQRRGRVLQMSGQMHFSFSNNLNTNNLKIVSNYHHGDIFTKIIKPWPFFRIMEGGMSLIKVGVMFSFPNVDPLSWGIAILLEKLAPEIRCWTSKAPFHTVYLIVSGDFMQSLSSFLISFSGNLVCSLMPSLYGFVRFA